MRLCRIHAEKQGWTVVTVIPKARTYQPERVRRDLERAIQAILDGVPGAQLKDKIGGLEARKAELTELLANADEPPPLLHPNMAEIYRQRIPTLYECLQSEDSKAEAAEVFRTLVDQLTLVPAEDELAIVLRGDLAAILRFAANKKNPDVLSEAGVGCLAFARIVGCGIGFELVSPVRLSNYELLGQEEDRIEREPSLSSLRHRQSARD